MHGRPRKKHRTKALEWLVGTEQQLLAMVGKGWLSFAVPEGSRPPPPPPEEEQATTTVSVDQGGGDGWAALHYLAYELKVAVVIQKDLAHRYWNDVWSALEHAELKSLVILLSA